MRRGLIRRSLNADLFRIKILACLLIENIKSPNCVAFDFFSKKFQSKTKWQTMTPISVPDLKIEFIPRKIIQFTHIKISISFIFVDLRGWLKKFCNNISRKNEYILVFVTKINKCNFCKYFANWIFNRQIANTSAIYNFLTKFTFHKCLLACRNIWDSKFTGSGLFLWSFKRSLDLLNSLSQMLELDGTHSSSTWTFFRFIYCNSFPRNYFLNSPIGIYGKTFWIF